MLYSRSLLVIHFKYSSVYVSIFNSLTIPSQYIFLKISYPKITYFISIWFTCFLLLLFLFVCLFWLCCRAYKILVPWPGITPMPPAVEAWSPNRWTISKVPGSLVSDVSQAPGFFQMLSDSRLSVSISKGLCQLWLHVRSVDSSL